MDNLQVKDRIVSVLNLFGMSGKKAAEIMNISYAVYRQNLAETKGHYFNESHYNALVKFIKEKAKELS